MHDKLLKAICQNAYHCQSYQMIRLIKDARFDFFLNDNEMNGALLGTNRS